MSFLTCDDCGSYFDAKCGEPWRAEKNGNGVNHNYISCPECLADECIMKGLHYTEISPWAAAQVPLVVVPPPEEEPEEQEDQDVEWGDSHHESMDGDFDSGMASAGFGTDEDYGYYGD